MQYTVHTICSYVIIFSLDFLDKPSCIQLNEKRKRFVQFFMELKWVCNHLLDFKGQTDPLECTPLLHFWLTTKLRWSLKPFIFARLYKIYSTETNVQNIWFLSLFVPLKQENLALLSLHTFEESVFIFQFLNDNLHSFVKQNIIYHSRIEK